MILISPLSGVLYLIRLGIDITLFFLVVHLILSWRNVRWLAPFDEIGKPLVSRITSSMSGILNIRLNKKWSEKGVTLISIAILSLTNLILSASIKFLI